MPLTERALWKCLRNRQINGCHFTRQCQIGPYFADFACRSRKLVVELDGYSHDMRQNEDLRRDQLMRQQGWHIMRFRNKDVTTNLEGVVLAISMQLEAMIADLPSPSPSRTREGGA